MGKRDSIISFCQREVGVTENPPGSNNVKYNDWYYSTGDYYFTNSKPFAWCGTFVAYMYAFSNNYLPKDLHDVIKYVPSAQNWLSRYAKEGDCKKGDIIVFDWNQDGFEEHIGIFSHWEGDYAMCYEGNTSPDDKGSQSNGGMVCYKKRHKSLIEGIYNVLD